MNKEHKKIILSKKLLEHILLSIISVVLVAALFFRQEIKIFFAQHKKQHFSSELIQEICHQQKQNNTSVLFTQKKIYHPYEPIEIFVKLHNQKISASNLNLILTVSDDNDQITKDIFDHEQISLIFYEEYQLYHVVWYPKNTSYEGSLQLEISTTTNLFQDMSLLKKSIQIASPKSQFSIPEGYTFLGLDSKEAVVTRRILSTKGKEISKFDLTEWFSLYNNDAVVMPVAVTKTFDFDQNKELSIWDHPKVKENLGLAKMFSTQQKQIGAWIQALEIDGAFKSELGYVESIRTNLSYTNVSWISISEQKRKEDLKKMVENLSANNDISFIGFTKALFYFNFHQDLLPVFQKTFPTFSSNSDSFDLWKQYQIASYFRDILKKNYKNKPIFFIFEGQELIDSPKMLEMAFAIGADFVMLDLESPLPLLSSQINMIKKNTAFNRFYEKIVLSYQINYNHLWGGSVSALENWVNENLKLLTTLHIKSLRIQDFYRALFGNRGPYPAYQWLLMIGDLISKWKEQENVFPIQHRIVTDKREISDDLTFYFEINNRSDHEIINYNVELLPLLSVSHTNLLFKLPLIKAREIIRTNISLSNLVFHQSILKKRTHFLGLSTEYSSKNRKSIKQVHMISVIDSQITQDQLSGVDSVFHQKTKVPILEERPEETTPVLKPVPIVSNTVMKSNKIVTNLEEDKDTQENKKDLKNEKNEKKESKETLEEQKETNKTKKRVPLWKRNREKNKEKEKNT
ncbi:MAG: hypothetical protein ACRCV0_05505 [Brevinema sp.]